jgi:hypothetical protein
MRLEIWPYGMKRAKTDLDNFVRVLDGIYSSLYDFSGDGRILPVTELQQIIDRLEDVNFTDVLLF